MTEIMNLTDAEIDGLSGAQLDEAVFLADGWIPTIPGQWKKGLSFRHAGFSSNVGAALGLLLGLDKVAMETNGDRFCVRQWKTNPLRCDVLATGPKSEAATVMARAWLKLKAREA